MSTGESGFRGVQFDVISVQYHSLKAGHDYGQYVRDAENAGWRRLFVSPWRDDKDSERARECHQFLKQVGVDEGNESS